MRKKRWVVLALGVGVAAVLSGSWALAGLTAPANAQQAVTVTLGPGRDASQTGTATLTARGDQTEVSIDIQPGDAGVGQPAHIHEGSCPGVGAVKYPLTNVVDGKSTTTVSAPLADLQGGGLSINIHKSQEEIAVYVSCGAIPAAATAPAAAPAAPPATGSGGLLAGDDSGPSTWWYALAAGGALLAVGGLARLVRVRSRK